MEKFRRKIQRRALGFRSMVVIAVIAGVYDVFGGILGISQRGDFSDGMVGGFSLGTIVALGILAVVQLTRLRKAMNDETQLRMLYNEEHDERAQAIRSKAGMPMILIMSISMLVAGVIGGYFNEVIFYTLFAAGFAQLLIGAAVKIYCMKTM